MQFFIVENSLGASICICPSDADRGEFNADCIRRTIEHIGNRVAGVEQRFFATYCNIYRRMYGEDCKQNRMTRDGVFLDQEEFLKLTGGDPQYRLERLASMQEFNYKEFNCTNDGSI